MKNSKIESFTLVELLIVLALISILATVLIVIIKPGIIFSKARDTKRIADIKNIEKTIDSLSTEQNFYELNYASPNIVYISLQDSSSTCGSYLSQLPSLPSGWSYHCSATPTNIDGTGWIPIPFSNFPIINISQLFIDPLNKPPYYYSFVVGGSYEVDAFLENPNSAALNDGGDSTAFERGSDLTLMPLTFPHNWIKIPGTNTWVMKYEAKYSITGKGADDAGNCRYDSSYDTWDWGKTGTNCPSSWSATNVVSSPYGSPIAGITHNEAKTVCQALGGHLITNQEWMKIARDAEQIPQNWSGGSVGSGCLFRGNVGLDDACGYNGPDPEKGINRNSKAKLILSNGEEIWDLSGNVWEHVMKDTNDTLVNNLPSDGGAVGWRWIEHTAITSYGDLSYNEIRPSNPSWNSNQGMGEVYTYNGSDPSHVLIRGGPANDGSLAGVFDLLLYIDSNYQDHTVGFRCAR